jgi:hypothetical protein
MSEAEMEAEYKAAKDEYEAAESAFARATARLNRAARDMCQAFDKRCAEAEARAMAKPKAPRREDWHYDSQGYCDNPGRGY